MFRTHRAPTRLAILVCLVVAATSLAASQNLIRVTTIAASAKGHDVFKDPQAVAVAPTTGALFIADRGRHQIAKVDPSINCVPQNGDPD